MSNVFTLEALRNETIRRYAPTEVELDDGNVIELASILRLGEKDRLAVVSVIEDINALEAGDSEDDESVAEWAELVVDACAKIFKLITPAHKKLIAGLDHDDPTIKANLYTAVLTRWVSDTQVGEA